MFTSRTGLLVHLLAMSSAATNLSNKFPSSIKEFGYTFNTEGKLRQIDPTTGEAGSEPFVFNVTSDPVYNQKRYEALGELITPYVYNLLTEEIGMKKISVPCDQSLSTFIFVTDDALSNPERLMILIHGSGVVRAGQWARSLIINDSLQSGTQIPYIQQAIKHNFGVMVLNTNDNTRIINGKTTPIKESSNPVEHATWVWENYVKKAKAKKVVVVAHSFGGVCAIELAGKYLTDFKERVCAIALTDSVHYMRFQSLKPEAAEYLRRVGRNWVSSSAPLDEVQSKNDKDILAVSAGHLKHEMTSWSCMNSLFDFVIHQAEK